MSPRQIALVQTSFAVFAALGPRAAEMFYTRLFALAPELRPLFPADMTGQYDKLMAMLEVTVSHLQHPELILPAIHDLGRRHSEAHIGSEHYDMLGVALLDTLGQQLGARFTPELEQAWQETYAVIATTMKQAAVMP